MATYHPDEGLLVRYAAGSLSEPMSLLVATHLALCPHCRAHTEQYDVLGGALLEDIDTQNVGSDLRDRVFAQLDADTPASPRPSAPQHRTAPDLRVPEPLRSYLNANLDDLDWRYRGPLDEVRILENYTGTTSRLLRIKAGKAMPRHTHGGTELTLVLAGGFTTQGRHFLRGDLDAADPTVDHAAIADDGEDCFCFAINEGKLSFTGPLLRLLNPFVRL